MRDVLETIGRGQDLSEAQATETMAALMEGRVPAATIGAFLLGLRVKGETVDEIVGFARAVRARAARFPLTGSGLVDTCGTGGDGAGTFNVSTAAAFIAAGAGVRIAKHGNRAVSSRTGSADVLEALGIDIGMDGDEAAATLESTGVAFLFAPTFHAAMRHVAPVRRELGVRTVFNLLGPLCNPAAAEAQVVGVFDGALVTPVAEALARLGARRAMVVHGLDGLDELTVTGPSLVAEWDGTRLRESEIDAARLGLHRRSAAEVAGGDAEHNASLLRAVLAPGSADDARRDIAMLNAAAAIRVAGLAEDLADGLEQARESVCSGAAAARLDALVQHSRLVRAAGGTEEPERVPADPRRVVEPPVPASTAGWAR